jgi:nitrate reductase NapAB chaperone NapD
MGNVAVAKEDGIYYELSGDEITFPLQFDQGGEDVVGYFVMDAQVGSHEIKAFLGDLMPKTKSADLADETEMESGDDAGVRAFVTKHFRGILGIDGEATKEEMTTWLDVNPQIKTRIYTEGYGNINIATEEGTGKLKLVLGSGEQEIKAKRLLYVPALEGPAVLNLTFKHRRVTEEERIRHRRAGKQVQKGRRTIVRINWDTIEQLSDSLISGLGHFLINGEACTEANKNLWLPKLQLSDKLFFVNRMMSKVAVKNG